jgi:hypothetical protein
LFSAARYHAGVSEIDPLGKYRTLRGWITEGKEFLGSKDDQATVRLRLATRTGRPAGGEELIAEGKGLTGCDLRKKPPGRPRKAQAKNRFMSPDSSRLRSSICSIPLEVTICELKLRVSMIGN